MDGEPAGHEPIRIALIEDHGMVRAGIRLLLERAPDIAVVGEAADGAAGLRLALDLAACDQVDVVVTDLGLPGLDGCTLTRRLKAAHPALPVLALTIHDDEAHVRGMREAGADGYVLKEAAARELAGTIRAAATRLAPPPILASQEGLGAGVAAS